MTIQNKFEIGDTVYLITDEDQLPRIVIEIVIRANDLIYVLAQCDKTSDHHAFEISKEKRVK